MPVGGAPVLEAQIGRFTFHGDAEPVLETVSLSVGPGSLTAVLGGSGSGKSTLGRLLAGWLIPGSSGRLEGFLALSGTRLDFEGAAGDPQIDPAAWCRQVGFVPQDASAMLSSVRATVEEELAFGLENLGMDVPGMRDAVRRAASRTGLGHLLDRDPASLSGGELRRVAIACAVVTGPAVLVLDEPFASLDAGGTAAISALVRNLASGGTAVVILSQRVDPPLPDADHWLILEGGTVVAEGTPAALAASPQLAATGVIAVAGNPEGQAGEGLVPRPVRTGTPALELRNVTYRYRSPAPRWFRRGRPTSTLPGVLDGVSLTVHSGEIVAVTGPNGAGKSTLLRHLNGLLQPSGGTVLIKGRGIHGLTTGDVSSDVGVLFQDPRDQLFERTAEREVGFRLEYATAGLPVIRALAEVGLADAAGRHPAELPGSQQRLLTLATVLARKPSVLALDEPTVALDRHGLSRLDAALRRAAQEGAAVVIVTHDLAYARSVAHRTLVLSGGRLEAG